VPAVTVVIPFLNGGNEAWLREAIGSLPIGTPYLVAHNDGELAEALNQALRQVETEFVLRLDADNRLHRDAIPFLLDLAWDTDVTYPSLLLTDEELRPVEFLKAPAFCPNRLLEKNYIDGGALFRPEKALAVGGYRDLPILEDWDLWVRMHRAGATFKAVPEAILYYRQHPGSRNKSVDPVGTHERLRAQIVGSTPDLKASFYYQQTYATTYWRCLLPARHLPGQAVDHPPFKPAREHDDGTLDLAFPEHRGAAVWQFPGDAVRAVLMSEQQEQGTRVLVETDDNYFDASPLGNPGWTKTIQKGRGHSLEAHRRIIPWVDGVIVTTAQLANRYRKHNPNVYVCPNQLDPADWPEPDASNGRFRVGWFASPSHAGDAKLVHRALEWASRQDDVEVYTMGFDPGWSFRRWHFPWSNDLGVYRKLLGTLDVGLAPVVETPWSVCRSDLKALELSAAQAAPVLSDATPYRTYEGPCLRATSAKDFLHHVKHLVTHRDEARQLGREARGYVMRERTMPRHIGDWQEAVGG
jgi:hypothetical protein